MMLRRGVLAAMAMMVIGVTGATGCKLPVDQGPQGNDPTSEPGSPVAQGPGDAPANDGDDRGPRRARRHRGKHHGWQRRGWRERGNGDPDMPPPR